MLTSNFAGAAVAGSNIAAMLRLMTLVLTLCSVQSTSAGFYDPGALNFSTTNQSMWNSGAGLVPETVSYSQSLATDTTIGGFTGSQRTVSVTSPAWSVWNSFCPACLPELEPAKTISTDIDDRTGSKTSLTSSGSFGIDSSLGLNGGSVDAELSFDVSLTTPNRIGVEEYFSLNPNRQVSAASLTATTPNLQGEFSTHLVFGASVTQQNCLLGECDSGTGALLNSVSDTATVLQINTPDLPNDKATVFELDHTWSNAVFDATALTLAVDVNPVLGPSLRGIPGLPEFGGVNLLEVSVDAPGSLTSDEHIDGQINISQATEDVIKMDIDLDAYSGSMTGVVVPGPLHLTFTGDLLDIDLRPTVDLNQRFGLDPTLMVKLTFDELIRTHEVQQIAAEPYCAQGLVLQNDHCFVQQPQQIPRQVCDPFGNCRIVYETVVTLVHQGPADFHPIYGQVEVLTNTIVSAWDNLPDIALIGAGEVNVTPEFWLEAVFSNETWFDYDLNVAVDILDAQIKLLTASIWHECVSCQNFPVANLGNFGHFDESFNLGGFQRIQGNSFSMYAQVPTPASLFPFLAGVLVLMICRCRRLRGYARI